MATRAPTEQEQQESFQLYQDINAVLLKVLGRDGELRSYHSFEQIDNYQTLESKAFYSFFVPSNGIAVQIPVVRPCRTLEAVARDGESCLIIRIGNMLCWRISYETQPTKLAIVHIVTFDEETFPTVPLRVNRPLVLFIKGPRKFSVSSIPEGADISAEEIDLYPMTVVKSTNLNEVIRMGTRQSVSINVKHDTKDKFWSSHRILINACDIPMLKPTIALDVRDPSTSLTAANGGIKQGIAAKTKSYRDQILSTSSSAAPATPMYLAESASLAKRGSPAKRTRGYVANPSVTATVTTQTQHQHPHTVPVPGPSTYQQYTQPSTSFIQHPSSVGLPGALIYHQYTQTSSSSGTQQITPTYAAGSGNMPALGEWSSQFEHGTSGTRRSPPPYPSVHKKKKWMAQFSEKQQDQSDTSITAQLQQPLSPDNEHQLIIDKDAPERTDEDDEL